MRWRSGAGGISAPRRPGSLLWHPAAQRCDGLGLCRSDLAPAYGRRLANRRQREAWDISDDRERRMPRAKQERGLTSLSPALRRPYS
jgi:hypothetical protein